MQPVLVPRKNVETGAVEGDEEGQATSYEKGTNLGEMKCFDGLQESMSVVIATQCMLMRF